MSRLPRQLQINEYEVGVYHCWNGCVQQRWLLGKDKETKRDFEHRKRWLERALRQLAGGFAIDVISFAVMSSHFHVVLRNRPDLVDGYDDEQVVRRWWTICPPRRRRDGSPAEMTEAELFGQLQDTDRVSELRRRLSSISWLLRLWTNRIARRANTEVGKRGHFWEGRFGCRRVLDEGALLACMSYVDLNPVRAGVCATPEESRHTSVSLRIATLRKLKSSKRQGRSCVASAADEWIAPIYLPETGGLGPQARRFGAPRASDRGVLPITLEEYLQVLDWSAKALRADHRGRTPDHVAPILDRLGIVSDAWLETLERWHEQAGRWVGNAQRMVEQAAALGQQWLRGIRYSRRGFRT